MEKKEGFARVDDVEVVFTDLPGTYSLSPNSPDEEVARNELLSGHIDCVIIVVDTTKLERQLYFAAQVIEFGIPCVVALNMFDEFEHSGASLDVEQLSRILGTPCVRTVGNRGKGVTELLAVALKAATGETPAVGKPPVYRHEMEHAIDRAMDTIRGKTPLGERWTAINLLLYGPSFLSETVRKSLSASDYHRIVEIRAHLETLEGASVRAIVTEGRYGYASGAAAECLKMEGQPAVSLSDAIDSIVVHRWLGFPIFLLILWGIFQATFRLGNYPMEWLGMLFDWMGTFAASVLPAGVVRSLVVDGVIGGVGGVLVFVPNIVFLFLFISVLEDTGYMARAAFIMDKVMHCFGLHGKSFIPMVVGFGCTVPAIMATRILENRRDRLITMFVLPFMSCGARLPVYILLAGAFFGPENAGNIIFSLYLVGVAAALLIARLLTSFQPSSSPFVMELPPYRIPTLRSVLLHIWERTWLYVRKAGTTILFISLVIWALMFFPRPPEPLEPSGSNTTHHLEHSFAGRFGKFIEPVLRPLGFDWRVGVALTAGFAAKEVIVSTLGTVYSIREEETGGAEVSLQESLRTDPLFNPVKGYGLMLFILLYVPCAATLAVVKREAGGWKWAVLLAIYTTAVAWMVSFTFIRLAQMIG